jgi:hypothetical protein
MGAKLNVTIVALIAVISSVASAGDLGRKPALHVDFNKMIDQNNIEKSQLHDSIGERINLSAEEGQKLQAETDRNSDRNKVIHFIDVEVAGSGEEAAPVVDRRFDSVGKPRTVDLNRIKKGSGS